MKIKIFLDDKFDETIVEIKSKDMNDEVNRIYSILNNINDRVNLIGNINETKYILEIENIISIYSNDKKVYVKTKDNKEYIIKERLYELENLLINKRFIRISNSEIINTKEIKKLDLSFNGSIKIITKTGYFSYVSRSYLKNFKTYFNL